MYLILGFTKRTSYHLSKYLLTQKNAELVISDVQKTSEQTNLIDELSDLGIVVDELGNQAPLMLDQYPITKVFLSPGVPRTLALVQEALKRGIEILNDIEFFYQEFPFRRYLAITGTDGKTTTCMWLYHVLKSKYLTVLCGNVGTAIFEFADEKYKDHLFLLELSSFQIESLNEFHPLIAGITNIHNDHLDRYDSFEHYAQTKLSLFNNLKRRNYIILNSDDKILKDFIKNRDVEIHDYSITNENAEIYLKDGIIFFNNKEFLSQSQLPLKGNHNVQNAMMVIHYALVLGMDEEEIKKSLCSFEGVPHRLQKVHEKNGVVFYNDSKATTVEAVKLALQSFEGNILFLAGGRSKCLDFSILKDLIAQKCKKVYLFGELTDELFQAWKQGICFTHMEDAVKQAIIDAKSGDVVLLSAGGTSFDEFSSFEERGTVFTNLVRES